MFFTIPNCSPAATSGLANTRMLSTGSFRLGARRIA
jgi:hypothetical protein